jgi:alpha-L-arabinofuranosidase
MRVRLRSFAVLVLFTALVVGASIGNADAVKAWIRVDTTATPTSVPPGIFGQNVLGVDEYGGDGGGLWDPDAVPCAPYLAGCVDEDAFALAERAGLRSLRFPGGLASRRYDWRQGVGDPATRAVPFGTEEFLYLADRLAAEPVLTVSAYEFGSHEVATPEALARAADWVAYANAESGPWADYRRRHGRPEPHGVRVWEVDSETWDQVVNPADAGDVFPALTPRTYAAAFVAFARAMKAVDPTIAIGAVAYENVDETDLSEFLDWFAENDPEPELWPDYLVVHYYRPNFDSRRCDLGGLTPDERLAEHARATMAAASQFRDRIETLRREVARRWAAYPEQRSRLRYAVSEYGTWFHFAGRVTDDAGEACPFSDLRYSLLAALYGADMLMQLSALGPDVEFAQAWNLADDTGRARPWTVGNLTHACGDASERPAQQAFRMLARDFPIATRLPVAVQSPTVDSGDVPRVLETRGVQTLPGERYLRIRLTRDAEPIDPSELCGADDRWNTDPGSAIEGALDVDDLRVVPEGLLPDPRTNLLDGGDFERGLGGWAVGRVPAGVDAARVCADGNCFFRLAFAGGNPGVPDALSQTIAVAEGTRYVVTARVRARGVAVKTRNRLCDAGFDLTGPDEGPFGNWFWEQYASTPAPAVLARDTFVTGPKSARVAFSGNPNYWHLMQRVALRRDSDPARSDPSRFLLRAWMKAEGLRGPAMVEAQQRDEHDQFISAAEPIGLYGTTGWQRLERRFRLVDPERTARITFHLRRKNTVEEAGGAIVYDDLGLYRDPIEYAPKLRIDLCADRECSRPRTISADTFLGDADWTERRVSGTPALAVAAGRSGDGVAVVVLNRDVSETMTATVALDGALGDDGVPRALWIGEIGGDSVGATREDCLPPLPGPRTPSVVFREPRYAGVLADERFEYAFPPHSLTAFRVVPVEPEGDDDPPAGEGTPAIESLATGLPRAVGDAPTPTSGDGCGCDLSGRSPASGDFVLIALLIALFARCRVRDRTRRVAG